MRIPVSWAKVETRLLDIANGKAAGEKPEDEVLAGLGLVADGQLTATGSSLFMARFVTEDVSEQQEILAECLSRSAVVTAFCEPLWSRDSVTVPGAIVLLTQLRASESETEARRWLELMNKAGMIVYNRAKPAVEVKFNPSEVVDDGEDVSRESSRGHVIRPDRPYGNVLALRSVLRAASDQIRWYEKHMGPRTLEVLYRELSEGQVSSIRLLCGELDEGPMEQLRTDFKRFQKEMKDQRGADAELRVLSRKEAFKHHDRFFITTDFARNLPPVNSILANSTGEILPSDLTAEDFDEWWEQAKPI